MKRLVSIAIAITFCCLRSLAQNQPGQQDYTVNSITFPLSNPPQPVTSISAQRLDNPGSCSYFYWVVAKFPIGNAQPGGPGAITNGTCSLVNGNNIGWTAVIGATSYDVLRTSTSSIPSGACGCAVATGVTGTSSTDTGSLTAYTVSTFTGGASFFEQNQQCTSSPVESLIFSVLGTPAFTITSDGALHSGSCSGNTIPSAVGTLTNHAVILGNGDSQIRPMSSLGLNTQVLTSGGPGVDPAWQTPATTTPGSPNLSIQFNNSGVFGGVPAWTWVAGSHAVEANGDTNFQLQVNDPTSGFCTLATTEIECQVLNSTSSLDGLAAHFIANGAGANTFEGDIFTPGHGGDQGNLTNLSLLNEIVGSDTADLTRALTVVGVNTGASTTTYGIDMQSNCCTGRVTGAAFHVADQGGTGGQFAIKIDGTSRTQLDSVNVRLATITSTVGEGAADFIILCNATGGTVSYNLTSSPVVNQGQLIAFKKIDSSSNACVLNASSGGLTIDGQNSISFTAQNQSALITFDGSTSWFVLATQGYSTDGMTVQNELQVNQGVASAPGIQHTSQNSCTTPATANGACNTTFTWPTDWNDAGYTTTCTLANNISGGTVIITGVVNNGSPFSTSTVTIQNTGANTAASQWGINCQGMH